MVTLKQLKLNELAAITGAAYELSRAQGQILESVEEALDHIPEDGSLDFYYGMLFALLAVVGMANELSEKLELGQVIGAMSGRTSSILMKKLTQSN